MKLGKKKKNKKKQKNLNSLWGLSCDECKDSKLPDLKNFIATLVKLAPFCWPSGQWLLRLRLCLAFLIMLGGRLVNILLPYVYKDLIDSIDPKPIANDTWTYHHQDRNFTDLTGLHESRRVAYPLFPLVGFLFLHLLVRVLPEIRLSLSVPVISFVQKSIELVTFKRLHELGFDWHIHQQTGKTMRLMSKGQDAVGQTIEILFFEFLPTFLDVMLVFFVLTIYTQFYIGLIALCGLVVYILWTIFLTECHRAVRKDMNTTEGTAQGIAVDSLLNFEAVRAFGKENHELYRYDTALIEFFDSVSRSQNWSLLITAGQATISITTLGVVMARIIQEGTEFGRTIGEIVAIIAYLIAVWTPLDKLAKLWRTINRNIMNLEALFELMETPIPVQDAVDALDIDITQGIIEFKNVQFSYLLEQEEQEAEQIVISSGDEAAEQLQDTDHSTSPSVENFHLGGISFRVRAGECVAIVGPSGSGKSTLSRLLMRYYDPDGGQILIDDQDIKYVTQSSLRKGIGLVPQDTILFNDTIQYNIAYGSSHEVVHAEDIAAALEQSQMKGFVACNTDGILTNVGERGGRLSGGERQRMAIARIFMKNPPILILDEATSALDTKTEQAISNALHELSRGRTTLIIAHRLSTVVSADRILVLKGGAIVEQGSHTDLLALQGEYAMMWASQMN